MNDTLEVSMQVIIRRCIAHQHGDLYPQCVCGLKNKKIPIRKLRRKEVRERALTPAEEKTVWKTEGALYNFFSGNGRMYNVIAQEEFEIVKRKS